MLSALLGELILDKGEMSVDSSHAVGYVAQTAWIQNASVQDNVLFGAAMDPARYRSVIRACGLMPDLEILPGGDKTEIGDRGVNLRFAQCALLCARTSSLSLSLVMESDS